MIVHTIPSPVGQLRLIADADALVGIYLPVQAGIPATRGTSPVLVRAANQLAEYFAGTRRTFDLPLGPRGTEFQQRVWAELRAIPFGETRSYGELAKIVGNANASRAVGAANGKNPLSIVVPCHRVIAGGGALTGYAGGIEAKRWLLAHEGAQTPLRLAAR
jgi:methylated-DNA-[protein]-cysteine S-methyltransferase